MGERLRQRWTAWSEWIDHHGYPTAPIAVIAMALVAASAGRPLSRARHAWLDWCVVGFAAYAAVVVLVVLPYVVIPRARQEPPRAQVVAIRWSLAIGPFLVSLGGYQLGAHAWVLLVGLATAIVLLSVPERRR